MEAATRVERAVDALYPDLIQKCDGTPFKRPEWTGDETLYVGGFYWANLDGDRFYFADRTDAAVDAATDLGLTDGEIELAVAA